MNIDILSLEPTDESELKEYLENRLIRDIVYLINRNRFFATNCPFVEKEKYIIKANIKGIVHKNDFMKLSDNLVGKLYYYRVDDEFFRGKDMNDRDELMFCLSRPIYHTVNALYNCTGVMIHYYYDPVAESFINKDRTILRDIIKKYYDALIEKLNISSISLNSLCLTFYEIEHEYLKFIQRFQVGYKNL